MDALLGFLSRISFRLLAFNSLLIFLPAASFLTLESYEQQLLLYQERSMVQQGRVLAAALGERGGLDRESIERILVNMNQEFDARLRVIDPDFRLLADSSQLGPRAETPAPAELVDPEIRGEPIYRLGNFLYHAYARFVLPPEPPLISHDFYVKKDILVGSEIEKALLGSYGANFRKSGGQRSLTLYSALPVRSEGQVVGAVLVSKSTFQILGSIYDLRLDTFRVILYSALAAVILSLLVATTIARPLAELRRQALAILDRRGRLRGRFKVYQRRDEIGDLSRALAELTRRLEGHLQFIESFASDVSHEFKNPLASIRAATDLLAEVEEPAERQRFIAMVRSDIARLERLLSGVREISHIDAHLDQQEVVDVSLRDLLSRLIEAYEMRAPNQVTYDLHLPADEDPRVRANADRLSQVLENLIDNAVGFSPTGGEVRIELKQDGEQAVLRVSDRGPGLPEAHLEKIFHRFFSYREAATSDREGHTGLGLSIVRVIVEGYGGSVTAANRDAGGAVFEVQLPLSS